MKYYIYYNYESKQDRRNLNTLFNLKQNKEYDFGWVCNTITEVNSEDNSDIILVFRDDIETVTNDYLYKFKYKKFIIVSVLERFELDNPFYKKLIDLNLQFKIVDANPFFKEWLKKLYNYDYQYKVYAPEFYLNSFNFLDTNIDKFKIDTNERTIKLVSLNNKQKDLRNIIAYLAGNYLNQTNDVFFQYVGSTKNFSEINNNVFNITFESTLKKIGLFSLENDYTKYITNTNLFNSANSTNTIWQQCIELYNQSYFNLLVETNANFEKENINTNLSTAVSEKFLLCTLGKNLPFLVLNSDSQKFYDFFDLENNNQLKYNSYFELLCSIYDSFKNINTLSLSDCKEIYYQNIKSIENNFNKCLSYISNTEKIQAEYNYIFNEW
jgi:hypothetical protein